jgi:hypothetical protein
MQDGMLIVPGWRRLGGERQTGRKRSRFGRLLLPIVLVVVGRLTRMINSG